MEAFYNNYFSDIENIKLVGEFISVNDYFYGGKIIYTTLKGDLEFDVNIPKIYPREKIEFYCRTIKGYEHQGVNQLVCLNSPAFNDLEIKLEYELRRLADWIEKYYVNDEHDERYEYPMFKLQSKDRTTIIYNENAYCEDDNRFKKRCGTFIFSHLLARDFRVFLVTEIEGQAYPWNKYYRHIPKLFKGIWALLDQEPIVERKERITNWKDLYDRLPPDFEGVFYETLCKNTKDRFPGDFYFLLLGYKIPNYGKMELNWDLILVPKQIFNIKSIKQGKIHFKNYDEEILWGYSHNASYNRLFGRGLLTENIVNSNILIIGIGAIGSNLASFLARGGQKRLTLWDNDLIEPGNEVRSFYDFLLAYQPKTHLLKNKLMALSPFIEVDIEDKYFLTSKKLSNYREYKQTLNKFDIIFDCSANMDVAYALSELQPNSRIIKFSITDEAKEFSCVCGVSNVALQKDIIFNKLGAVLSEGTFYPGTGCWQPTFKANSLDINMLLAFAMEEINFRLENKIDLSSFVIKKNIENNSIKINMEYGY